jgi:hypothetical protein
MQDIERKVIRWLLSGDTGVSSTALCAHMIGEKPEEDDYSPPSDPSDLGRCLRLLEILPEWKARVPEMAVHGPGWAGLVEQWDTIVNLYYNEGGVPIDQRERSPETYKAMKLAIAHGYRNDPRYICSFDADGTLYSATFKDAAEDAEA